MTALSGSETVEQAYALARLLRRGLGAHSAVMPEVENSRLLDGFRLPLSSIRDAQVVVVLGDEPVEERAPIVDLWIRAARRNGAEVLYELDDDKVRDAERAILIWSGADGEQRLAVEAERLAASGARSISRARRTRAASRRRGPPRRTRRRPRSRTRFACSSSPATRRSRTRTCGRSPRRPRSVLVLAMFERPARGLADLVLPGTSYLEREGTYVNLEGRLQRLRRAVLPPAPDELAWIAALGERFGVDISPYTSSVFDELRR